MRLKRIGAVLMAVVLTQTTFAQKFDAPKKTSAIGFSANLTDFSASLPDIGKVDPGFSLMYWKGLTKHIDFSGRYNGLFSDYTKKANTSNSNNTGYINELEASLHARLLSDDHLLNPFISAGVGAGNYGKSTYAGYAPLGIGLQVNMYNEGYLFLQGNYRVSFDEKKLDNNTFFSLGFTQTINRKKTEPKVVPVPEPVAPVVVDTDGDGIPDEKDACPTEAGPAATNGCPDTDGDGIADKDDKCPNVAGLAKYNGCPIPDTDGDGINDEEDKCPQVAGVARYNGCPVPDTDGDGVNDELDKCPGIPGPASNNGCPVVKEEVKAKVSKAAENIYFATGKATLLAKSNKGLDAVAAELIADKDLKVAIAGHTDNTGKEELNQKLSESRAKAVYDYLLKKGVSERQLSSTGFGQSNPVADNKTAAGRAKNRRVELNLGYE